MSRGTDWDDRLDAVAHVRALAEDGHEVLSPARCPLCTWALKHSGDVEELQAPLVVLGRRLERPAAARGPK
jgi:hypothetical protein